MPWLTMGGERFMIPIGRSVVGSSPRADFRVVNADLMPRHFVLESRNGVVWFSIYGMDTVAAIGGHQCGAVPRELRDGEVIDAGSASFVFGARDPLPPVTAEPPGAAWLVDEAAKAAFRLGASTAIGRDPSNEIHLHEPTASRFHAEVRREAGGYVLHPMGSSGTRLNGTRLAAPRLLEPGDEIEIAYARYRFGRELPDGVSVAIPEDAVDDDEASKRPTLTMPERGSGRTAGQPAAHPRRWVLIALIVLAVAALVFSRALRPAP